MVFSVVDDNFWLIFNNKKKTRLIKLFLGSRLAPAQLNVAQPEGALIF